MSTSEANEINGLPCIHHPAKGDLQTFAFVNALTGSTDHWETVIAPALRKHGYGTISYNFRGQDATTFTDADPLDQNQIIADMKAVLGETAPDDTILVGLSIGGLFAARAHLEGLPARGLVLINTLRQADTALEWTNEAIYRTARLGGPQLVVDLFGPMLVGADKLADMRPSALGETPYEPLAENSGILRLIDKSRQADWDLPYANLDLPVLVMTGLRDRVFLNRDVVGKLIKELKQPYHVELPDAGHLIPIEAPDAVVDVLKRFAEDLRQD